MASNIAPPAAFVQSTKLLRQKNLPRSYPKVVSYLLKKVANDQAIAKADFATLRYMQPTIRTPMQYADGLYSKSCKAAQIYDEYTSNDILIEGFDFFISHSLREYWTFSEKLRTEKTRAKPSLNILPTRRTVSRTPMSPTNLTKLCQPTLDPLCPATRP